MSFRGHRGLRLLLAGSLIASLAACGGEDSVDAEDNSTDAPDDKSPNDDGDDTDVDDTDTDTDTDNSKTPSKDKPKGDAGTKTPDAGKAVKNTDGGAVDAPAADGGAVASGPCEGLKVGARCVKKEHYTVIEHVEQLAEGDNLVYDFDKSYENNGALKKGQKIKPSADLGEWYLYNGDYVRIGVGYSSYIATGGSIADKDRLPQREGRNKDLTWNLNAVIAQDGGDVAAPNCTVCHFAYFEDKLIRGLGRNKHWIASDASGFTLDVLGIGINTVFTLDLSVGEGLGMLLRLFPEIGYSHLFDLFAALAMKHDPNTLKWTGDLAGGDPNSHMKGWIDFPNWWGLKKKNAVYHNASGRGHLSNHLWYMNWFSLEGTAEAEEIMNNFVHVQKFLTSDKFTAPKFEDFGGKINKELATKGEAVFNESCATCHGTYSEDGEETYPNALIDVAEVGTEPTLAKNHWIYPVKPWYDKSWYAKVDKVTEIVRTNGYLAPPLDGVWITAPYLHNGSVPTLEQLLDPSKRLDVWTSNMGAGDYDYAAGGWTDKPLDLDVWTLDQNFGIYDVSEEGNSNKGHTYGAALSPADRKAVLEYLKTL